MTRQTAEIRGLNYLQWEDVMEFPIEWKYGELPSDGRNGPPVTDPLIVYAEVRLCDDDEDDPYILKFNLRDAVHYLINMNVAFDTHLIAERHQKGVIAVRDGLRELADMIDAKLEKEGVPPGSANPPPVNETPTKAENKPREPR